MIDFEIKYLSENEWQDYKSIRLEALKKHPEYFCPSRNEAKFTEEEWRERLVNPNAAQFGLYADSELIGLTGIFREREQAHLVQSYIREDYRGKGLSKLFYKARLEWAREQEGIKRLVVEHRDDNLPSKGAHQNFGFQFVKSRDQLWPDGQKRPCLVYHLELLVQN